MKGLTTQQVKAALRARFCPPTFAFLDEVRNGTGFSRGVTRTADGLAMSLWPSRGLELHGFEIKVSRSDWQRELEQPEKAEAIAAYCDRWWLAVGDPDIVRTGELPATWGLLVPKGVNLVVHVEPQKLEAKPLDRLLLAAILRRATTVSADEAEIAARVEKRTEEIREQAKADAEHQQAHVSRAHEALTKALAEFTEASGVDLRNQWEAGQIGEAVREVLRGNHLIRRAELRALLHHAERITDHIRKEVALLPATSTSEAA